MLKKYVLLFNTIKHLKFIQIYYRLFYFGKNKLFPNPKYKSLDKEVKQLIWRNPFLYENSFTNNRFIFLNVKHEFADAIDWNYSAYGKLWTYNINYFDFLNQKEITKEQGLFLIDNYIEKDKLHKDGKEPYPISLRGINWIKFLSIHKISNPKINKNLYTHYQILLAKLEYHLLGNHLLENGFSLFFGAYYFKDENLYNKAIEILKAELMEQTLKDGAHFELSPMYHQLILFRILDCLHLQKLNPWKSNESVGLLHSTALKMLGWLENVTFKNGNIPMVNDCAYNIAPSSTQLFTYAKELNLSWNKTKFKESGYRKYEKNNYELFVDVGNIGPTYQPGHAHADTFNFELYINEQPFIVETGTSTYENNEARQIERSTSSHNTVTVNNTNQSQIWGGFRVGKRAKTTLLEESDNSITSKHDGYKNIGIEHKRKFEVFNDKIEITDSMIPAKEINAIAYFHLHPSITKFEIKENSIQFLEEKVLLKFNSSEVKIETEKYLFANGFNNTIESIKIKVHFKNTLTTSIQL